jgi:hypothetical protein
MSGHRLSQMKACGVLLAAVSALARYLYGGRQ